MFSSLALALTLRAPRAVLHVEVADTEVRRERGLMDRRTLAPHRGMIFVFDRDQPVIFWMKDTRIALDMIFVDAGGTVRSIDANVPVVPATLPDERIPREMGKAKYVIELAAGEAAKDGIVPGVRFSQLRFSPLQAH
ncbi:MAG: DUF192 domain-containing protein [Candidatus Eremiobacteraeota bacterium]|nr:DUF192 domain-containing protein [Candidatus Eremiobacteraeota bacterium]